MVDPGIPTIDLSPFLRDDVDSKKKAMEIITQACSEYGFFQIVNHGVSLDLFGRAIELSKIFFDLPDEEKNKSNPSSNAPLPAGYNRQPLHSPDKNEYVLVFPPGSSVNVYPENPSEFRLFALHLLFSFLVLLGIFLYFSSLLFGYYEFFGEKKYIFKT